jgi:hypothetical protein
MNLVNVLQTNLAGEQRVLVFFTSRIVQKVRRTNWPGKFEPVLKRLCVWAGERTGDERNVHLTFNPRRSAITYM